MTDDKITEMDLMAYADGQLSPERQELVAAHIAADPEAGQRVEMYRNLTGTVSAAFDAPMREAPPDRLVEFIRNADVNGGDAAKVTDELEPSGAHDSAGEARDVIQFPPRRLAPPVSVWRMAAAAAVVATVGVGVVNFWQWSRGANDMASAVLALGPLAPNSPLHDVLERRKAGEHVNLRDGRALTVVGTFRDRTMRFCREFEVLQAGPDGKLDTPSAAAVACRGMDGRWSNEGVVAIAAPSPEAVPGSYVPSGASEKDALEILLQTLGAGTALSSEAEGKLLKSGWQEAR